ncbi:MAG: hypothetical protein IT282_16435, partial [Bacteroidetes bacterium]|nr:hypothetical protein [Bacteroidota bacterium]
MSGGTHLEGCSESRPPVLSRIEGGGVRYVRELTDSTGKYHCRVTDEFRSEGAAVRWDVTIEGLDGPWSTGIATAMTFPDTAGVRFWTPWGSPGHLSPADWGGEGIEWHDPFETRSFRDMHLVYGGHFGKGAGFAIPVFAVMDTLRGSGISLAMSPEDLQLDLHMITNRAGEVTQVRRFHRIVKGRPIRFTMHIFEHEADWRPVVAFMVDHYPRFFRPPLKNALDLCALGAYSSHEGAVDTAKYRAMGGILNWKASFDFSYMGMFIPPVPNDTTQWQRFDVTSEGRPIPGLRTYSSIERMRSYARTMKSLGFATLNYFNVTEFGGSSVYDTAVVFPPRSYSREEQVWQNPSAFLSQHFPGAVLFGALDHVGWHKRTPQQHMDSPVRFHTEPFWTWGGAIATDVGDSAYAAFLLDQAIRHVEKIPDAQGICMDRFDWFNEYNWHADDGVSWAGGRSARSLLVSFREFIPRLSGIMHEHDRAMFCNPHMNRLELMEHFDGVYNEFGHIGHNLNLSAFLCLFKPLLCWTPDKETVMKGPDEYFQRHLLMGAFPTAPFPGNDHTIRPDSAVERHYLAYGRMFQLLKGREWVLLPRVAEILGGTALCNLFRTGEGALLLPVMMGTTDTTTVIVRHVRELLGSRAAALEIWYPGRSAPLQTVTEAV